MNQPMSDYNRNNPFLYMMDNRNSELDTLVGQALKNWLSLCMLEIVMLIFSFMRHILYHQPQVIIFLVTIGVILFILIEIQSAIRSMQDRELDQIKYGEEYTYKTLNNEDILNRINQINVAIGKVTIAKELILCMHVLDLIIIAVQVVFILSYFFTS